jgi:hypothetical protein
MARKIKIPNEIKKRHERATLQRQKNIRSKRVYYLIVCEGAKTEPNYFEGLKRDLPLGVLTACQIEIEGTGYNTQSLIDEAIRLKEAFQKETGRPIDRLWVVFDRDSFTANDFNSAVNRCYTTQPSIGCAWSNEAFELWYLLHFHFYNNAVPRADYKALIEGNLRPVLGQAYEYRKNSVDMYDILKKYGSQADAIRNARNLHAVYEQQQDYTNHNPCTVVYALVEELFGLNG